MNAVEIEAAVTAQRKGRAVARRKDAGESAFAFLCIWWVVLATHSAVGQARNVQPSLHSALSGSTAIAVVLDGKDGHLLAAEHPSEAARLTSVPGSVLKPLFLTAALERGLIRPDATVYCGRNLRIAGRYLACTHPLNQSVFSAETALAYSCNSYFANLATRFTPEQAIGVLRGYGLGSRTGLLAREASGIVRNPESEQDLQLFVLGLKDSEVTPVQLAHAYWELTKQLYATPAVERGLTGSVAYGMAHNAATPGLAIAGKTGTASDSGQSWTHGWFAGIASHDEEKIVIVVYVPRGNGADAAQVAHRFLTEWRRATP